MGKKSMKSNNILFLLHTPWYKLFKSLIYKCQEENYKVNIHFYDIENTDTLHKQLKNDNINLFKYFNIYNMISKLLYNLFNKNNSFHNHISERILYVEHLYNYYFAKKLLIKNNIKFIFTHTDTSYRLHISFFKAAKDLNIPIVVPAAIPMEPDLNEIRNHPRYMLHSDKLTTYEKKTFNKFKDKKYGQQVLEKHFRYRAYIINFLDKIDSLSTTPFVFGGSPNTTYLGVSNKFTYNSAVKWGVDKQKIHILGDINLDTVFDSYQNKDIIKKQYNTNQPIAIIALPQLFEHKYTSEKEAFEHIEFMIFHLFKLNRYKILLSLHPMMDIENYIYLEKKFKCQIIKEPLNTILPIADLFIATPSNTIIWAVLCEIKTIVYDIFSWDFTFVESLLSINRAISKKQYLTFLNKIDDLKINFNDDFELLSKNIVFNGQILNKYIISHKECIDE
jgi:hypothetical protein